MPAPLSRIETRAPLACLHCAGTQATVLRDRQNADNLLGYANHCVCCDPETGNACPQCGSQNLEYGSYDGICDSETGYADAGDRYRCLDCGSTGDVDETPSLGDTDGGTAQAHDACEYWGGTAGRGVKPILREFAPWRSAVLVSSSIIRASSIR
jgi:hypothetical protein